MTDGERHRTGGEHADDRAGGRIGKPMGGQSGGLTEEQAGLMLAGMNEAVRAGEEARRQRTALIALLTGLGWTQERIARLADMSQPAVSKHVAKSRADGPSSPMDLSPEQSDAPWLEGRLWALAETVSDILGGAARCTRHTEALARGRKHFTPETVDELRRLVEEDLRLHRDALPAVFRDVYDRIGRALDVPPKTAPVPAAAQPSVRRALAHRIQRDLLAGTA
ncbi:sigma-70 family RNA polymerase sigma factor [Streptomyces sp. NPDC092952]|uniref:sigma-70 family RNA polymerase sigma factor n=1 Tax=Streptomyces sp. NPDC092952 TaxID=3366018 RepID=UPI0037F8B3FB